MRFDEFIGLHRGKKVTVCGLGVSNMPLIRLLRANGVAVEARDRKSVGELEVMDELRALGCKVVAGEDYLEDITADIVYRSPGMRPDLPGLKKAVELGAVLTSEMEMFFEVCPCKIIGVTGSDGKTTTSTCIAKILELDGKKVWLGGNIGNPLLDRVPEMTPEDFAVVELSSFQLMTMTRCPDIAVVTNVSPNHLDLHKDMKEYIDSKRNIFLRRDDMKLVLNYDNDITRGFGEGKSGVVYFSRIVEMENGAYLKDGVIYMDCAPLMNISEIRIPGMYNVENYMAVFLAVDDISSRDSMRTVARTFSGVEHRIEFVREKDGVKYYNNSIGSSPTRTAAALTAFDGKVILIAGGYDKHIPFDELAASLEGHVKKMVLVGATSGLIADAAKKAGYNDFVFAGTFEEACEMARDFAAPGDTVLLSPACAAFDLFKNFAERGNRFKEIVNIF